jgi:hypothetical protein
MATILGMLVKEENRLEFNLFNARALIVPDHVAKWYW